MVKSGQQVSVRARVGTIEARTHRRRDAERTRSGDLVRVVTPDSKKTLIGRVVASGEVEVLHGSVRDSVAASLVMLAAATVAEAGPRRRHRSTRPALRAAVASDNYDELFVRYLQAARTPVPASGPRIDWMSGLSADFRARSVNDLVTVQVIESIVGTGTADSNLDKKSSGHAAVPNLFGLESKSIRRGSIRRTSRTRRARPSSRAAGTRRAPAR